jgi:hypothetical protein
MDYKAIVDKLSAVYLDFRNKKMTKEEYDEIIEDTIRDVILQEPYYEYRKICKG